MSAVLNIQPVQDSHFYRPRNARLVGTRATATRSKLSLTDLLPLDIVLTDLETGYVAIAPIPVRLERAGDGFEASFTAANIHTSAETLLDAMRNLRSLIMDVFDSLLAEQTVLGPGPQRQLAILLRYVKKDDPQ